MPLELNNICSVNGNVTTYTYGVVGGGEHKVFRTDYANGKKSIKQERGFSGTTLPFALQIIKDAQTLFIVEGEKCVLWCLKHDIPAISYRGGKANWSGTDWTALAGKEIRLLPDNNGREEFITLAQYLADNIECEVVYEHYEPWENIPSGWDIADLDDYEAWVDFSSNQLQEQYIEPSPSTRSTGGVKLANPIDCRSTPQISHRFLSLIHI